jgi:hypothetical protein
MRYLVALLALAVPSFGLSQVLSTAAPNNGSGGVFLDLTASGSFPLFVTQFDVPFSSVAGTPVQIEVWTRPGSYVGFDGSSAGWTLLELNEATSAGSATWAPMILANPILLGAGVTTGIYLHAITVGGGIRYTGTNAAPPQTTWSNADITLFSDVTRTGTVPFGGTRFTPRTFSGNVHYQVVPEPASLAALGLGAAAMIRRRRRKG